MQDQLSAVSRDKGIFRPFEADGDGKKQKLDAESVAKRLLDLQSFNIKAGSLKDEKSQNLYK